MHWEHVDRGWGRYAPEVAYLFENLHWREYLHLLNQTGVGPGTRYLDIACGSGLAVRLAGERGAFVTGLDASPRLAAIAAARSPGADIRVGDMFTLPFPDYYFEVATSFRGIWGNCFAALREARRVVCPGGKVGLSFWGHQKQMPAHPLCAVLGQTTQAEREHTGAQTVHAAVWCPIFVKLNMGMRNVDYRSLRPRSRKSPIGLTACTVRRVQQNWQGRETRRGTIMTRS